MADGLAGASFGGVDERLADWRQGDCVVGDQWFLHRFDPALPLTAEATEAAAGEAALCETPVRGLVVLTQTCDLTVGSVNSSRHSSCGTWLVTSVERSCARSLLTSRRSCWVWLPRCRP